MEHDALKRKWPVAVLCVFLAGVVISDSASANMPECGIVSDPYPPLDPRRAVSSLPLGRAANQNAKRAAGGMEAESGAWPWMASIYSVDGNGGNEKFECGASIVNENHLITAAHCFLNHNHDLVTQPSSFIVRVKNMFDKPGKKHLIESITTHPRYQHPQLYYDIAVIKLKEPVEFEGGFLGTICLPTSADIKRIRLRGRNVTLAGWGGPRTGSLPVMQDITMQVQNKAACSEWYDKYAGRNLPQGITQQFVCAGPPEGVKDTCTYDSGGPLMLLEKGVWFMVGVVSFGLDCAIAKYPGIYTRVDSYLVWLKQVGVV